MRPDTGRFFTDENDVTGAVAACLGEQFAPRAWFRAVHGPDNAASRLAAFLDQVAARSPVAASEAVPQRQREAGQALAGGSGAGGIGPADLRARGEPAPPAQV